MPARPQVAQAFQQLLLELLHLRAVIRHVHAHDPAEASAAMSALSISASTAASPESVTEFAPLIAAIEMACG